jgi:large subunit ribosomal protein L28
MTKRCELTDVGAQSGNMVSHSNRKSRRRFVPNLNAVSVRSDALKQTLHLRLTAATLRSIDHNGGLDNFLVTATASKLSEYAQKLRRKIKKAQAANPVEGAPVKKAKAKKAAA